MNKQQLLYTMTTPLNATAYTPNVPEFRNREYFTVLYETDPEAIRSVLPEPLEFDEPVVKFECIKMPDSTALGSYTECGQLIPCRLGSVTGEFSVGMYLDNFPSIAVGREIAAYPKKLARPALFVDSDTLVATLAYGSVDVAIGTMAYKMLAMTPEEVTDEVKLAQFMVKMIRDPKGAPIQLALIKTAAAKVTPIEGWRNPARLQLFPHVHAPLADLPVRRIIEGKHYIANVVLGGVEVVHDYLAE